MGLAHALKYHRDELICDLAEVYGIYDYRRYPARYIATLCAGLGPNSRVALAEGGVNPLPTSLLLGFLVDIVSCAFGGKGKMIDMMTEKEESEGFDTADDFEEARKKLLERING